MTMNTEGNIAHWWTLCNLIVSSDIPKMHFGNC